MPRIVVVEDDRANALVIERVLTRMGGHEVFVTEDAGEVLDRCAGGRADLVLMDVSLSNTIFEGEAIDGLRLTRLIRERVGSSSPPVLLLTAHAMRGDRERLLRASGADGYMAKPIVDHGELVCLLDETLATAQKVA